MVNKDMIDSKIKECSKICQEEKFSGNKKHYQYDWAIYSIKSYIDRNCASVPWLEKFCSADARMLMDRAAKASGTDAACIKAVSLYLKVS